MARLKKDERLCPYCAEVIKAAAVKCRYCQSELEPAGESAPAVEPVSLEKVADESPVDDDRPAKKASGKKFKKAAEPEPTDETAVEDAPPPKKTSGKKSTKAPTAEPEVDDTDESVEDSKDDAFVSAFAADSTASAPDREEHRPGMVDVLARKWLTAVLAVLVVAAAVAVGLTYWQPGGGGDSTVAGAQLDEEARTQVLVSAADLAQRSLSYSYRTLDQDAELARARMTSGFRKDYDATLEQVRANTVKNQIVLQATVTAAGIEKATEKNATALVFVNQTTSAAGKNEQIKRIVVKVTMKRDRGDWKIDDLTAIE